MARSIVSVTTQAAAPQEGANAEFSKPYLIRATHTSCVKTCQTQCRIICLFCAVALLASFCAIQAADETVCDAVMSGDGVTALEDAQADEASCF